MRSFLLATSWLIVFSASSVLAEEADEIGKIKTLKGAVSIQRANVEIRAQIGMGIVKNDVLLTGSTGAMGILFNDNSTLSMGNNTKIQLSEYEFDVLSQKAGFVARIRSGTMVYLSGLIAKMNSDGVKFKTRVAIAGVRGTKLAIKVEGKDDD